MKDSNCIDEEDFDYQEPTTLEDVEYDLNQCIYELEDKYKKFDIHKDSWVYSKFFDYIPKELLAHYIIREVLNAKPNEDGEVEIKHIDNMSDNLSERFKKYKPIAREILKVDKKIFKEANKERKRLIKENKFLITDLEFTSFLGDNLNQYLTGTEAREARRNVDSFDEIEEVLIFLSDISFLNWEELSFDLQKNHSAKQPIKWTQIKSNLANHLEECITALHPIKCDKARINKLSTFIINNIITDSSIMTQIRNNQYYADLSAVRRLKSNPVSKRQIAKDTNDRIRP